MDEHITKELEDLVYMSSLLDNMQEKKEEEQLQYFFSGFEETEANYIVSYISTRELERCPHCGSHNLRKYGYRHETMLDLPYRGKKVLIKINRHRFNCADCRVSSVSPVSFKIKNVKATTRMLNYVKTAMKTKNISMIANDLCVSNSTVKKIVDTIETGHA